jgi:glycosyltransferase involved in cell wall biosynthesis
VHLLANALCEMGESVTVFSLSPAPADARYAVRQVRLPDRVSRSRFLKRYLLGYYFSRQDTRDFDVIHAHGDNYLLLRKGPQVRTYYGSALAEAIHAGSPRRFLSQLGAYALELAGLPWADARAAISPGTRAYLPAIDAVVPCGIDLRNFTPGGSKSPAPSILFVGALSGRKHGDHMLRIFGKVREQCREAELWMVMPGRLEQEGVRSFTALTCEELVRLYRSAWILCMPSSYEGFGVPLIEAMACGTPVVAAPSDGPCYVLEEGRHGLLVPPAQMAEALGGLLASQERLNTLKEKGLKRAAAFDIRNAAQAYRDIYHAVIQRRRKP